MLRNIRSLSGKRFFSNSSRLNNTLTFVEVHNEGITPGSLSLISAAQQIGKPITAVLAGSTIPESAISSLKKISNISKVVLAKDPKFDHSLAENLSPLFTKLLSNNDYTHFFVAASAVGKSVLPRVGALLDVQPISDIIKIENENTFVRPIYAGNALATVKSSDKIILASVRASAFPQQELNGESSPATEEANSAEARSEQIEFVSEEIVKSERPDLGSALKVVSGGRGLKSKEQFDEIILPLASKLGAGIGASRAAVDSGFCDNSLQVGQTGKVVAPDLYVAVGISGAIQHLAGMKDSKVIVAINKDEEAPIFNVADIGLVGDLFEVVPDLTKKL